MRTSTCIRSILVLAGLSSGATAQSFNSTESFKLKISSANATLDGSYLFACHSGAAIEQLCFSSPSVGGDLDVFYLNYTSAGPALGGSPGGILVWDLPISGGPSVPSALSYSARPTSNVMVLTFYPGNSQANLPVGFDRDGKMVVYSNLDDSVVPPMDPTTQGWKSYSSWYICYSYLLSYRYEALSWVTAGPPRNPTCQKVEVIREI